MVRIVLGVCLLLLLVACPGTPPPEQTNQPPVASFSATTNGLQVSFDASGSADSDGAVSAYLWDFGDGGSGAGQQVSHAYADSGTYTVILTITDDDGATAQMSLGVTVEAPGGSPGTLSISGTVTLGASPLGVARQLEPLEPVSKPAFLPSESTRSLTGKTAQNIIPGEILIKFESGLRSQAQTSLRVTGTTFRPVRYLGLPGTALYRAVGLGEAETLALAQTLAARPDIRHAAPNYRYYPLALPNDEGYSFQWHYPAINLPQAWDLTQGAANTVVAVIDTGIINHPELSGRLLPGYDFISDSANSADGDGRDNDPTDTGPEQSTGYHGTHVAGTIAANTDNGSGVAGVDWNAKILPVRVLGVNGGSSADIIEGILWAAGLHPTQANPHPADVLNLSLGGTAPCNAIEQEAFDDVIAAGKIVVVAAGNENQDAGFVAPGNCANVITVGATDFAGARAPYSNFGTNIEVMGPGGDTSADLNQDGYQDGVLSLGFDDNSQTYFFPFQQGTSMATPHVAGVASLMKAVKPSITQNEVLSALTSTARALNGAACSGTGQTALSGSDCGAGLIDAFAALQAIDTTTPPPPNVGLSFSPTSLDFGTQLETMALTMTNGDATPLSWSASQFFTDADNPGDVLDNGVSLSVLSGNIPAGGSQTITVGIDRSKATADGSYRLEVELVTGTGTKRLPITFTKNQSSQPPAGDLSGTLVLACFVVGESCDDTKSSLVTTSGSGLSVTYTATELVAGDYILIGWKDSNVNTLVDAGDFFGFYSVDALGATEVMPPATNIDFLVEAVDSSAAVRAKALLQSLVDDRHHPF